MTDLRALPTPTLIHDVIHAAALRDPAAPALVHQQQRLSYAELAAVVDDAAAAFLTHGLARGARVAVYLEKRVEAVAAMFGAAAAGAVFVPVNPLLKPEQVAHILNDCDVSILVTSAERIHALAHILGQCSTLQAVFLVGASGAVGADPACCGYPSTLVQVNWSAACAQSVRVPSHRVIDTDVAAILYTSGSTGKPKGVVLSHRNLCAGAGSVAAYLGNTASDRILAVLPLSFDYGLSQLTCAFLTGATVVLLNHLLPRDVLDAVQAERITGLAAVPPLWMQLAGLPWPRDCTLRYLTNSGGSMPRPTLEQLQRVLPHAQPYLMYGLTEAFRSTYLPPAQLSRRPDSIGRPIPNAEVLVLRPDGSECDVDEAGELVHRGALVALGYWNDPGKTAERFRPVPAQQYGLPLPELAVWSGDTVRRDADGYLYFISRNDEMIKSSGYRVSPTEVEDVMYADARVAEAVAIGAPHPVLGHAIVVVVVLQPGQACDAGMLLAACRSRLPGYMVPNRIVIQDSSLPRNPNGKIDRSGLRAAFQDLFAEHAV